MITQFIAHVFPQNAAVFFNKPAEGQGQWPQDLVLLYREKTNSSEEREPIISGPDPTTYWQEICTVPIIGP